MTGPCVLAEHHAQLPMQSYKVNPHTFAVTLVQLGMYICAYMVVPDMTTVTPVLSHHLCNVKLTRCHLFTQ